MLGGQTHWTSGGLWTQRSAIGSAGGTWSTNWSPLAFADPPAIEGGALKASTVQPHFLTQNLTSFHVHGAGSGAEIAQNSWNESVLARLRPTAAYPYGQSLLAIHFENKDQPGRVVDLGFNPWSTDVASGGGGYDPTESPQAAPLIARALWWATDRIPPTRTHFTSKPPSPSKFATVSFSLAARDADPASAFTSFGSSTASATAAGGWRRVAARSRSTTCVPVTATGYGHAPWTSPETRTRSRPATRSGSARARTAEPRHSHSMVDGGLLEMSSATRLTPAISLMMRLEIRSSRS